MADRWQTGGRQVALPERHRNPLSESPTAMAVPMGIASMQMPPTARAQCNRLWTHLALAVHALDHDLQAADQLSLCYYSSLSPHVRAHALPSLHLVRWCDSLSSECAAMQCCRQCHASAAAAKSSHWLGCAAALDRSL